LYSRFPLREETYPNSTLQILNVTNILISRKNYRAYQKYLTFCQICCISMRVIFLLFSLLFYTTVSATTYYLAPGGNDVTGNGTIENPWFSLNKAWNAVSEGDIIYMRGGIYYYPKQSLTGKNGSTDNMIRIWAYPGEIPVIRKSGTYSNTIWPRSIIRVSCNYVHFKGLEICYNTQENQEAYYGLINLNGNYNIYEQLNIHHNGWAGLSIEYNSTGNLILNCDIHHNSDPMSSDKYGNADGIDLTHIPAGAQNTIRGCRIWWNSDDGIDTYGSDSKLEIDSCWVWYNGFIPDTFTPAGNGIGIKLGKTATDLGNTKLINISNSLAYRNRAAGFHQNGAYAVMVLLNNTAYMNGADGFWLGSFNKPHIIKNNLSYKNKSYCCLTTASILQSNNFLLTNGTNPQFSVNDADFMSLDGAQINSSRKENGNLPDITFLHPVSGSDLLDSGTDVGLYYYGKAPDIGAFEIENEDLHRNQFPVINIFSSAKNESFTSPATVTLEITAFDPDGSISNVELYNGNNKIAEITEAPYLFTLKDLVKGTYSLYAIATDNFKSTSSSSVIEFVVTSYDDGREYFTIFPNPNKGIFSIDFSVSDEVEYYSMSVVNMAGKTIYRGDIPNTFSVQNIDLSFLTPGTYILLIESKFILAAQKFIKV